MLGRRFLATSAGSLFIIPALTLDFSASHDASAVFPPSVSGVLVLVESVASHEDIRRAGLASPRLTALAGYLKSVCHCSFSTIRKHLRDSEGSLCGRPISFAAFRHVVTARVILPSPITASSTVAQPSGRARRLLQESAWPRSNPSRNLVNGLGFSQNAHTQCLRLSASSLLRPDYFVEQEKTETFPITSWPGRSKLHPVDCYSTAATHSVQAIVGPSAASV